MDRHVNNNAWLIRLGNETRNRRFSVTVDQESSLFRGVEKGDGVLIAGGDPLAAVSFARIYRIRAKLDETTFFFDGVLSVNGGKSLTDLGMTAPESKAAMVRLEWPIFEAAMKTARHRLRCPARTGRRFRRGTGLRMGTIPIGQHRKSRGTGRVEHHGEWCGGHCQLIEL